MSTGRPWHAIASGEAVQAIGSSPEGLGEAEAGRRLDEFGRNEVSKGKGTSWFDILLHQVLNPLVVVLVVAAVIALIAGETIDAIVIVVVIILNTAIGFFQEYRAEAAIDALRSRAAPQATVLRCREGGGCTDLRVNTTEIVPGDIILLEAGDKVPADARLIEAANLEVDESMLTGESLPVTKTLEPLDEELVIADRTNLVYGGTIVTEGRGRAVVYATGQNTQLGQIATLIEETEKAVSPLQKQTYNLGKNLGVLSIFAGLLILLMGILRGLGLQELFLFAIAAVVSVIPEGLPAVMTITLAVGVNRMAKRNAIIRKLPAVDTLGATTVICTDKTGTLTTNQMTVQQIYTGGRQVQVTGSGFTPAGKFQLDGGQIDAAGDIPLRQALEISALCNNARLVQEGSQDQQRWEVRGDPTEGALVVAARKAGLEREDLEQEYPRVDEVPFSSQKKFMATFHKNAQGETFVFLKGAPETVLKFCTQWWFEGEVRDLIEPDRERIHEVNEEMAGNALRVLAVACQKIEADEIQSIKERLDNGYQGMVFAGLLGMMDPPRTEAFEAIERCKRAGIRVIMATGDHQVTGQAVARDVGILGEGDQVLTGQQMDRMSDEELDGLIQRTAVFARVAPAHKQRIVASLQRHNEVVAMTGDGVNDAPALKAAEIGVAMGITGTDVTKETAEMVLTDDNFASIVNAAEEGRVVFQNVRKVIQFLVSTNAGEVLTILGSIWLLPAGQLIFTPVQILWVNLVTDGLLDITIALEPKEGDVMDGPPRRPDTAIIDRRMLLLVIFVAVIMAAGTLWVYLNTLNRAGAAKAQTMAFITLSMFQVFNALNVRSRTRSVFQIGLFSNKYLILAILTSIVLLILATLVPFLQIALNTVPLSMGDWGTVFLVSSSVFIAGEIRKFIQGKM